MKVSSETEHLTQSMLIIDSEATISASGVYVRTYRSHSVTTNAVRVTFATVV